MQHGQSQIASLELVISDAASPMLGKFSLIIPREMHASQLMNSLSALSVTEDLSGFQHVCQAWLFLTV